MTLSRLWALTVRRCRGSMGDANQVSLSAVPQIFFALMRTIERIQILFTSVPVQVEEGEDALGRVSETDPMEQGKANRPRPPQCVQEGSGSAHDSTARHCGGLPRRSRKKTSQSEDRMAEYLEEAGHSGLGTGQRPRSLRLRHTSYRRKHNQRRPIQSVIDDESGTREASPYRSIAETPLVDKSNPRVEITVTPESRPA